MNNQLLLASNSLLYQSSEDLIDNTIGTNILGARLLFQQSIDEEKQSTVVTNKKFRI